MLNVPGSGPAFKECRGTTRLIIRKFHFDPINDFLILLDEGVDLILSI